MPDVVIVWAGSTFSRHLARALAEHARWCQRNGIELPAELAALLDALAANGGQWRPSLDGTGAPLLSYAEAGERLGVSARTVRRRVEAGELPAVGKGRGRRVPAEELRAWQSSRAGE
jgi:excisionase family DNA binding protein